MRMHKLINPNDSKVTALQSRRHTSLELIEEYAAQMAGGLQFDPCSAIETPDGHIYIWDGKHRLEAAIRTGSMLLVELEPGMERDAHWRACSANKKHGLKRSHADIQKAVQEAITLRPDKSDREIGLWVGCDHKTVGKYRDLLQTSGDIPQMPTRTVVRNKQEYQMEMPIKTAPVETSELNPPVRHLTGFVPPDVHVSTQKSLTFKPRQDHDSITNTPAKPTPTQQQLKSIVKAFMGLEFDAFPEAYEQLGHLCNCWQSQEPYVSLVNRLSTHLESLYAIDYQQIGNVFALRGACRAAYDDWTALYNSGYRGVLEPEAPASTAGEQEGEQDAAEEQDDFETRLARCYECLDKYYLVKVDGVLGVTKIVEVNHHLAKVRGVTYPYDPYVPFKDMACGTLNFELKELIRELTQACWESSKSRTMNKGTEQPAEEPAEEPGYNFTAIPKTTNCDFCGDCEHDVPLYHSELHSFVAICRKCALKAQIALGLPDDDGHL